MISVVQLPEARLKIDIQRRRIRWYVNKEETGVDKEGEQRPIKKLE